MKTKFDIWIDKVNKERKTYWDKNFSYKDYTSLEISKGNKYMKIMDGTSVWAFVSMIEGSLKNSPIKPGDLLKPASWRTPAKHSRGNIFDGTDTWSYYGPSYLI
jgi:hypothetical protein